MPANRTIRDGIVVGLIAYAAVALFYSAFDLLAARGTLYTVDLLGKSMFRGLRDPGVLQYPVTPDLTAIFWYNAFHLAASIAIGVIVTSLLAYADRNPAQSALIMFIIIVGFVVTVIGVGYVTTPIRPLLPWWSIIVANGLATLLGAMYLLRMRPGLSDRLMSFAR
jgi:hypothetical protein